MTPGDEDELIIFGEGNAGCSGGAGFSTAFVSILSAGFVMTLFDKSRPSILVMYNKVGTEATVITMAITINAIWDLRFNNQGRALFVINMDLSLCNYSYLIDYSIVLIVPLSL